MKKVEELIEHLKKHKDAVIIIGPGVNSEKIKYTPEEFNSTYNRKNLKRDYQKLMKFYFDKIDCAENNSKVYDLISNLDRSMILEQNINGPLNANYLHGHVDVFKCIKCKTIFKKESLILGTEFNTECECCGGKLRPSVLLSNERYDQALFDNFKEHLLNTHTLIVIGMDYSEEAILNLIADYGNLKVTCNASGNPEEEKMLVCIQSDEETFNLNDIAFCEFYVKGNIEDSLERLMKLY